MSVQQAQAPERSARIAALWLLVAGLVIGCSLSVPAALLVQLRLRVGCAFTGDGWVCDEAAVPWLAGGIALSGALALGGTGLVLRATRDRVRLRADLLRLTGIIAVLPTLVLLGAALVDAIVHDASVTDFDGSRVALWAERAMLAAIAAAVAGAVAATGLRMRARGQPPRAAFLHLVIAFVLLALAALMSSLAALPTVVVAAAAIGAAWRVAAAAWPKRHDAVASRR